jgi:Zn-dependent peptidase ImmA (M78 family)
VSDVRLELNITNDPSSSAIDVLRKTVVSENNRISLPIDVDRVAQRLGLIVERMPLNQGTDGMLVRTRPHDDFRAVISTSSSEHRARFTLAHEIGHFVRQYYECGDEEVGGVIEFRDRNSSTGTDENEVWANAFAAALLMPPQLISRMWGDGASVEEMCSVLNVSEEAMRIPVQGRTQGQGCGGGWA